MIDISAVWKALFAHKMLILTALAASVLVMYVTPLGDIISGETAFAAKGGGGKPPDDDQGEDDDDQGEDDDGDYGHTVKPPKPHK